MTQHNEDIEEIGNRLREARQYRGYSQKEIADILEVSRSTISLMENGRRKIEATELQKLAEFYDVSIDRLLGEQDDQESDSEEIELLARKTRELSPEDREEVLQFAEFLRARKSKEKEDD
jgi:transcriptional regulator with XRE-family HTH domain